MKTDNKRATNRFKACKRVFVSLLVIFTIVFACGKAVSTQAVADTIGQGGEAFAGPDKNTFVQNMNVQTIYLDHEAFKVSTPTNIEGEWLQKEEGKGYVQMQGSKLPATGETEFADYSWDYVYPSAAIYPDGSKGDVKIHCVLNKIYTASLTTTNNSGSLVPTTSTEKFAGIVRVWGGAEQNYPTGDVYASGSSGGPCRSFKAFVTTTFSVSDSTTGMKGGTYILPITGDNAFKGSGQAWKPLSLYNPLNDSERIRKEEVAFSGDKYIPENSQLMSYDKGNTLAGKNQGASGVDNSYIYGFAVEGSAGGTVMDFGVTGGWYKADGAASGGSQGNTIKHQMGDLQRRIWSGSGPHGSISIDKTGKGIDLPGGKFDDPSTIPSGKPDNTDEWDLRRYVIPFDKMGVTYTMTPDKGYTLEKLVVDEKEYVVPDVPESSVTIVNDDGDGTLKYEGGGKFTYTFADPNTQDHEIYVTWKRVKADINVKKIWHDLSKAPDDAKIKLSWGNTSDESDEQEVQAEDDVEYKWEDKYVFEYDANGNAGSAIKYTLEETPDPVSADYAKAVWEGADKKGAAVTAGFTLEDPDKANGAREKSDPLEATVYNILKKDVEITKKWDDQSNKFDTRPSSIIFKLYSDEECTQEVTGYTPTITNIDKDTDKVTWLSLPAYDKKGDPVTYYIKETVPEGYTVNPADGKVSENGTITNKYIFGPKATGDETYGAKGEPQKGMLVFTEGSAPIDFYKIEGADADNPNRKTIPGVGVYNFDPATGIVTFTPDPTFDGDPEPLKVTGTDKNGLSATATYTPHMVDNVRTGTVKQDITYTYLTVDGDEAATTVTRTVPVKQVGIVNPVTGMISWSNPWTTEDGSETVVLSARTSPEIRGGTWVPNVDTVDELSVNPNSDSGITFDPASNTFTCASVHVVYQPKDADIAQYTSKDGKYRKNGKDLITQTSGTIDLSGKIKTKTLPDGSANVITGHTLIGPDGKEVPGGKLTTDQGTYELIDNGDTFEVKFTPSEDFIGTADPVTVQSTDKLSELMVGMDEYKNYRAPRAVYTPTVVNNKQTVTIKREINYTYLTPDGAEAHEKVVQVLSAERVGTYNPATGKVDYDDNWTYPQGKTFPAVNNPNITGWSTNDIVGEYTISGPYDVPPVVHIVYQKNEPKPTNPEFDSEDTMKSPETGDRGSYSVWFVLAAASVAVAVTAAVLVRRKKRRIRR